MPTQTTNYNFNKPLVNNATDADLWGGQLNSNWDDVDSQLKSVSDNADFAKLPVGAIYFNTTGTNPGTELGYGTWAAIAEGRFIVGVGEGTDANSDNRTYSQGNDSVGEYEHTLTTSEMPSHSHTSGEVQGIKLQGGDNWDMASNSNIGGSWASGAYSTNATGGGGAHENSPPAFGLYVWERTA